LDVALESKHVVKPSNGWYSKVNTETGEIEDKKYREKDTNTPEFWNSLLEDEGFKAYVESKYRVANGTILQTEEDDA
jgi:hypothetical protein